MSSSEQCVFIRREILSMTLSATAQRSGLYKQGAPEKSRKPFQVALRTLLEALAKCYAVPVAEETHIQNIQRVVAELSDKHADVLTEGGLRIGLAQKALNLYLKYLWCLGKIPEPPHCPIDAIVLNRVPGCEKVRWTRMQTVEEYCEVIEKVKVAANGMSLAQWELSLYNASRPAGARLAVQKLRLFKSSEHGNILNK